MISSDNDMSRKYSKNPKFVKKTILFQIFIAYYMEKAGLLARSTEAIYKSSYFIVCGICAASFIGVPKHKDFIDFDWYYPAMDVSFIPYLVTVFRFWGGPFQA